MGALDFLHLRRNNERNEARQELHNATVHAGIMGSLGQNQQEQEYQELLASNGLLVNDPMFEALMKEIVAQAEEEAGTLEPDDVTLLGLLSNKIRTSFLEPEDAEIYKFRIHAIKLLKIMDMEESEFFSGDARFWDMVELHAQINLDNAKNGKIAKLVKATTRVAEVTTREYTPQKEKR